MINRRAFIGGASAVAGSYALGPGGHVSAAHAHGPIDLENPRQLHTAHRKLVYTLDDANVYWYIDALRMGFRDGELTPMWNFHAGLVYRITTLGEFRYRVDTVMKIYYTRLEDRATLLTTFDNPYTGKSHEVVQPRLFKTSSIFGLAGIEQEKVADSPETTGRRYINEDIGPGKIVGDDVWINADMIRREEMPNRFGRLLQVNDWMTFHGSLSDLADPGLASAPATMNFNDLNTWNSNWSGMVGTNSWSFSRGMGRKTDRVGGMPQNWRNFISLDHPELLTDTPGFQDPS